jgi:hypothetical protein
MPEQGLPTHERPMATVDVIAEEAILKNRIEMQIEDGKGVHGGLLS